MGNVVGYGSRSTVSNSSVGSGSGGGDVEDILKRLGNVETHVSELRSQVSAISAIIPHLATKADVADVRIEVGQVKADLAAGIGQLKADLATGIGQVKADVAAVETAIIKWIVATVLASAALAFTIAKFVH
jgi:phage-related minor tail protein